MLSLSSIDFVRDEAETLVRANAAHKQSWSASIGLFFGRIGLAMRTVAQEPEILFFAFMQWVVIAAAYFLFASIFYLVPDEVWQSARDTGDNETTVADIVLLVWGVMVIGIAALPIGILSGCIPAVHFLKRTTGNSTVGTCLKLVLNNTNSIWMFTWLDSWITVRQIFERLPSKDRKRKIGFWASEALYYAWKVGTAGVLPALVGGKGMFEAGKASVKLLTKRPGAIMALRTGYSLMCWIVGIAAYILGAVFIGRYMSGMEQAGNESAYMVKAIMLTGGPVVVAAGVIQLFLRPIYLLAVTDVYCEELEKAGEMPPLETMSGENFGIALAACGTMCLCLVAAYLNRDAFGITEMLSTPYQ